MLQLLQAFQLLGSQCPLLKGKRDPELIMILLFILGNQLIFAAFCSLHRMPENDGEREMEWNGESARVAGETFAGSTSCVYWRFPPEPNGVSLRIGVNQQPIRSSEWAGVSWTTHCIKLHETEWTAWKPSEDQNRLWNRMNGTIARFQIIGCGRPLSHATEGLTCDQMHQIRCRTVSCNVEGLVIFNRIPIQ